MENVARFIMLAGLILLLLGAAIYGAGKLGVPLGGLPGDIRIERPGGTFYFPLASSIVISVVLTILLNIFLRLRK